MHVRLITCKTSYGWNTANKFILCSIVNMFFIKKQTEHSHSKTMFLLLCSKRALQHLFQMCYHIPKIPYVFSSSRGEGETTRWLHTDSKCNQSKCLLFGLEFTLEYEDKHFFMYLSGGAGVLLVYPCMHDEGQIVLYSSHVGNRKAQGPSAVQWRKD